MREGNKKGDVRRAAIVAYVSRYIKEHGYSPSFREISEATGIKSGSEVERYLYQLREQGLVTFVSGRPRTVRA